MAGKKKGVSPVDYCEIRESCESLCSLFLLVRAVRVVRGSQNLNGESAGILTAKCAKTANKKGSVPSSSPPVSIRNCLKGSVPCIFTVKYAKTAKVCVVCFSLFVPFALFAVHRI